MTKFQWDEFEKVLQRHLSLEVNEPVKADDSLIDSGLDSIAMVQIMFDLEDVFGFTFPPDLINESTFRSPAALWQVVNSVNCVED